MSLSRQALGKPACAALCRKGLPLLVEASMDRCVCVQHCVVQIAFLSCPCRKLHGNAQHANFNGRPWLSSSTCWQQSVSSLGSRCCLWRGRTRATRCQSNRNDSQEAPLNLPHCSQSASCFCINELPFVQQLQRYPFDKPRTRPNMLNFHVDREPEIQSAGRSPCVASCSSAPRALMECKKRHLDAIRLPPCLAEAASRSCDDVVVLIGLALLPSGSRQAAKSRKRSPDKNNTEESTINR